MKSQLIDLKTDEIFMPEKKEILFPSTSNHSPVNRRDFLVLSLLTSTGFFLLNEKAEANPFAIIGVFIVGSIIRGIARVIGRTVARKLISRGAVAYTSLSTKVQSAVVEEVVTDLTEVGIKHASTKIIHELANDNSKALWAKNDKNNPLVLKIENKTNRKIETPIKLALKPANSRRPEMIKGMILKIPPFEKAEFKISTFRDLPSTGLKRIISGIPSSVENKIKISSSNKLTVMKTRDIYT